MLNDAEPIEMEMQIKLIWIEWTHSTTSVGGWWGRLNINASAAKDTTTRNTLPSAHHPQLCHVIYVHVVLAVAANCYSAAASTAVAYDIIML